MSTARAWANDDYDIQEYVLQLNTILLELYKNKENDALSGMMVKFLSEAIKLQHASLQDGFSQTDKTAIKETLCAVVDFFSVPSVQTFSLLQQQLAKQTSVQTSVRVAESKSQCKRLKIPRWSECLKD